MRKAMVAAMLAAATIPIAQAEEWREPQYPLAGFYGGFDLGGWRIRTQGSPDLTGFTYSPFVGYQINRYVGFEAAYIAGSAVTADDVAVQAHVAEGSLIGSIPLTGYAGIYARAGVAKWWSTATISFPGFSSSYSDNATHGCYGAGLYQHFGDVAARLEYTRSSLYGATVNRFTAGVYWKF
jgi:opacity protein-like surface antigen